MTNLLISLNNILGVYNLLEAIKEYKNKIRLIISTDEVYGDILGSKRSDENSNTYQVLYSASKASSDHLVTSYVRTYGIDAVLSMSNNYGPRQFLKN